MTTMQDLAVPAVINILVTFASLLAFGLLRSQPINDRVYLPKSYINGRRKSTTSSEGLGPKLVNLKLTTFLKFLNSIPEALEKEKKDIIKHDGVDSAAYLRLYLLGLKMFVPIAFVAILVLVPVNVCGSTISFLGKNALQNDIDKLSISNVSPGSQKFWFHVGAAYIFTLWTCFLLYQEYSSIAATRLQFFTSKERRAEQFTVIVRFVPSGSEPSVSKKVKQFFQKHYPSHYRQHQTPAGIKGLLILMSTNITVTRALIQAVVLAVQHIAEFIFTKHYFKVAYNVNKLIKLVEERKSHNNWLDYCQRIERLSGAQPTCRTGFLGLFGRRVGSIDYHKQKIEVLRNKICEEERKVLKNPLPVAFVSFNSRLGAAICAQTQQCKNPYWLTDSVADERDVYWQNLVIPFVSLIIRRLVISVSIFALMVFCMIPIAIVLSLANLDGLAKVAPFLMRVNELKVIKSFLQGFLPGLALKIFLFFLGKILTAMSIAEGHMLLSKIHTIAADKHYYFMLVNVFLGSIVSGTVFQQLNSFPHQPPSEIAKTIGVSVPTKATFFITYIMLDGWSAVAVELLRTKSLALYHLRTEKDREQAMEQENIGIAENLPRLQLYFLLGLVYAVVSPILLPFVIIFFGLGFLVYRHQIINVYDPQYESVASFWPRVHESIMTSLITSHFHLIILLSTKEAPSTPLLTILLMLTIGFRNYCKKIFEPTFSKHPVEEAETTDTDELEAAKLKAAAKGTVELEAEPVLKLRPWLDGAYLHPIFRVVDDLMKREASSRRTEDSGSPVSAPITRAANDLGHQRDASSRRADCSSWPSPSASPSISELSSPSPQYYGLRYV